MLADKQSPSNTEEQRLQVLYEHRILDTPAEAVFDRFVRAAQDICQTPIAVISLIDEKRQWFKAKIGLDIDHTPRDVSFCTYTIQQPDILIIPDAREDERFAHNPFVVSNPGIRFYAGVPLKTLDGYALGTLCVVDFQPHHLTPKQIYLLKDLSRQVTVELQRRRAIAQRIHKPANDHQTERRFLRHLTASFVTIGAAIILSTQIGTHLGNKNLLKNERWVAHTLEVISDIEAVNGDLALLQTTMQEYVISGDLQLLSTFDRQINALRLNVQELRELTSDNAVQQHNLNRLQPILEEKLASLKQIMAVRKSESLAAATVLLQGDDQRTLFPIVRALLNQMRQEEERLLTQRLAQTEASQKTAALISGVGRLLILGIILATFGMIWQEMKRRQRAEDDKEEQRELLEVTFSSIGDGVVVTDCDRRITSMNPIAEALTGWAEEDAKNRSVDDVIQLVQMDTGDAIDNPFHKTMTTLSLQSLENGVGLRHRDGSIIPVDDSCAPVFNKQGVLQGAVMVFRDATLRTQAEAEIQRALAQERELNELKSNFISMVSHDIRTPLTIILSSVELLQRYAHKATEEQRERYFKQIRAAVKRMQEFLDDVLLVSKVDSGALKYEPVPLNLHEFCLEVIEEVELSVENSHEIVFSNHCDCSNTHTVDPKLLHHILTNLLSNAVKYSPERGTVYLDIECQNHHLCFSIRDEGIGIPEDDLPQLFSAFHRARNVGKIAGTGLGLSIVKNCVDLHSGEITVRSKVNQGTTFTVTLPICS